ncbi:hypothetical protein ACT3SQ_04260 [Brachybacterium sp. AOP42-C2-15]|uniref:hypothetical protein n=1 Tax=Brachybacterium sp. AOP42-C2-15 TaxID=3457670 RepID=UPI0040342813
MSDGESTTPTPRRRPSYGLPGPTSPAPTTDGAPQVGTPGHSGSGHSGSGHSAPGHSAPGYGTPEYGSQSNGSQGYGSQSYGTPSSGSQSYGSQSYGTPGSSSQGYGSQGYDNQSYGTPGYGAPGADQYAPQTGPLPASVSSGGGASGGTGSAPRRRRGLWPLIIGLVLLLVIGPAATIGGIVWSVGSLAGDASAGPVVMQGPTEEVEVAANQMLIVYVPQADAAGAECTAEGTTPGAVSVVPNSTSITFGDGSQYEQKIGVAALEDTTVTVSCTGTDAPAYLGPYSVFSMAAPLLIGPIIGVIAGLIGLVLTIIGIVLLVKSRRS